MLKEKQLLILLIVEVYLDRNTVFVMKFLRYAEPGGVCLCRVTFLASQKTPGKQRNGFEVHQPGKTELK